MTKNEFMEIESRCLGNDCDCFVQCFGDGGLPKVAYRKLIKALITQQDPDYTRPCVESECFHPNRYVFTISTYVGNFYIVVLGGKCWEGRKAFFLSDKNKYAFPVYQEKRLENLVKYLLKPYQKKWGGENG